MSENSNRTKNSLRNTLFGLILRIVNMVGGFATRTILIYTLGIEYVGLEGLFASVLTFLNMAELGFNTAVVYKLYKPIADHDEEKVCALLNFYRTVYRTIGIIVLVVGLSILPFLNRFVKGTVPDSLNIDVLYLIYLLNTCFSYWLFAYKHALLNASQRNDLSSKITSVIYLGKYLIQIVLLLLFRNYYVFVIIIPLTTLAANLGHQFVAKKYYPMYVARGKIGRDDRDEIVKKISGLLFNKIGVAIINGSDNIVISSFLGLTMLGIYDSYYYVFSVLYGVFAVFHNGITASVGNSIIKESVESNKVLFKRLTFLNSWIIGWSSICLMCMYTPFISVWVGNDRVLGDGFSLIMALYFYFWMIRFIVIIFKNAQGLWWEDRFRAILEGILNLIMNILAVQVIGIYGVTISTIVSMLLVSLPWEVRILYKQYFHCSTKEYYCVFWKFLFITIISGTITYFITLIIPFSGIARLLTCGMICLIVPNLLFAIVFHKTAEFKWSLSFIKKRLLKIR